MLGEGHGRATDIAVDAADVVLMHGGLGQVYDAIQLSRASMRNIRENLFWAFAYNTVCIPAAAGVFYAFGGGLLNPVWAGAAMALSSICVVSNALRLRWYRPKALDTAKSLNEREKAGPHRNGAGPLFMETRAYWHVCYGPAKSSPKFFIETI